MIITWMINDNHLFTSLDGLCSPPTLSMGQFIAVAVRSVMPGSNPHTQWWRLIKQSYLVSGIVLLIFVRLQLKGTSMPTPWK